MNKSNFTVKIPYSEAREMACWLRGYTASTDKFSSQYPQQMAYSCLAPALGESDVSILGRHLH